MAYEWNQLFCDIQPVHVGMEEAHYRLEFSYVTQILVPPQAGCALPGLVYVFPPLSVSNWAMRTDICFLLLFNSVSPEVP